MFHPTYEVGRFDLLSCFPFPLPWLSAVISLLLFQTNNRFSELVIYFPVEPHRHDCLHGHQSLFRGGHRIDLSLKLGISLLDECIELIKQALVFEVALESEGIQRWVNIKRVFETLLPDKARNMIGPVSGPLLGPGVCM